MTRPPVLVLVAGTATAVGKTWLAATLAETLRQQGRSVAVRKPVQSFDPGAGATDAEVLAGASGEEPYAVCPVHRWYERAMAPFMAADALGRPPFDLGELVEELEWSPVEVGLVESAGGVRSPLTSDGADTVDLAVAINPDLVILVADPGLGTLNSVRLCRAALNGFSVVVFLNRYDEGDDLHRRNLDWLAAHGQVPVLTAATEMAAMVVVALQQSAAGRGGGGEKR